LGLEREPKTGLPAPLGLGFQPEPAFRSAREAENGFAFAGRNSAAPSVRGVKERDELEE